jgi:CheY-like chemotaxis protein
LVHRPRVLLADDNVNFLELISELLRQEFEIIARVGDGAAAVAAAITLQPDLVVSDLSMPHMSGLEVAARLRALNHSARVVIVTVHQDAALRGHGRKHRALNQPVTFHGPECLRQHLWRHVEASLQFARAQRSVAEKMEDGDAPLVREEFDRVARLQRAVMDAEEVACGLGSSERA